MLSDLKYFTFSEDISGIDTAILIKDAACVKASIKQYYLRKPIDVSRIVACNLKYEPNNKLGATTVKQYMEALLPELVNIGIKSIYVADAKYFQYLTKQNTTDSIGTITNCKIKGFEHLQIIAGINYQSLFHNPSNTSLLDISVNTLLQHLDGYDVKQAKDIIKSATYFKDYNDITAIANHLNFSQIYPVLAVDIETSGKDEGDALRFNKSHLESIAFAHSESEGSAIYIHNNPEIKKYLRSFFTNYTGKCVYHNGLFDIKHLIYHLFMESPDDIPGMLKGIDIMCKHIDDTMVMTYLCTNNAQENKLGLKHNALPYTGQYAVDVKDVSKLPVDVLLEYNLKDCLGTFWLWLQQSERIIQEEQDEIYQNLFLPAFKVLLETMLVGLPMEMNQVEIVKNKMEIETTIALHKLESSKIITDLNLNLQTTAMHKANAKLKKKVKPITDFLDVRFNPSSGNHKRELLYETLKLPVIDLTKTKLPAVGGKTLKKLKNHTDNENILIMLDALIEYSDASKILTTFIKAFQNFAFERYDGTNWLNGDQILCGTISGRLGSKNPNLANLPSGSKYGKLIKSCFKAPDGWLFAGADFSALEDRIVAILSDDPNKKKPFTQGVDGHCLNTYGYWGSKVEDILGKKPDDTLQEIEWYQNFKKATKTDTELDKLRSKSKSPTFALNYNGTWATLVKNCGFTKEEAEAIEAGHKELYKVLHAWSAENRIEMVNKGYASCAFGLKVRTPLLAKSLLTDDSHILAKEFRAANNAKTQSWGLLTTRAGIEFRERLNMSEFRDRVVIINFIHDAIYLLVYNEPEVIQWVNKNLIECMQWQEHPLIKSDEIKLEAELDLGLSWDKMGTLKNNANIEEIEIFVKELFTYKEEE